MTNISKRLQRRKEKRFKKFKEEKAMKTSKVFTRAWYRDNPKALREKQALEKIEKRPTVQYVWTIR